MAGGSAAGGSVSARKPRLPPKTHDTGAPTKCTPETMDILCAAMESLGFVGAACARAGVARSTVDEWALRGKAGEEPFATFAARWAQARARANATLLEQVRGASAGGDWRAAAWLLERAHPDEYPREPSVTVTTHVHQGVETAPLLERIAARAAPERSGSA